MPISFMVMFSPSFFLQRRLHCQETIRIDCGWFSLLQCVNYTYMKNITSGWNWFTDSPESRTLLRDMAPTNRQENPHNSSGHSTPNHQVTSTLPILHFVFDANKYYPQQLDSSESGILLDRFTKKSMLWTSVIRVFRQQSRLLSMQSLCKRIDRNSFLLYGRFHRADWSLVRSSNR